MKTECEKSQFDRLNLLSLDLLSFGNLEGLFLRGNFYRLFFHHSFGNEANFYSSELYWIRTSDPYPVKVML